MIISINISDQMINIYSRINPASEDTGVKLWKNDAQKIHDYLDYRSDNIQRTIFTQIFDPHSCAFITEKPQGNTKLIDGAFTIAVRVRLRFDQLSGAFGAELTTATSMPAATTHSCQNLQGNVKRRYDLLRDAIFKQCSRSLTATRRSATCRCQILSVCYRRETALRTKYWSSNTQWNAEFLEIL